MRRPKITTKKIDLQKLPKPGASKTPAKTIDTLGFTPSVYQRAYYDEFLARRRAIALVAEPGSGKSTTILGATKLVRPSETVVYVAYNKAIQMEFAPRISPRPAVTVHSLSYAAIRKALGYVPVEQKKVSKILYEMLKPKGRSLARSEFDALRSVVETIAEIVKLKKLTLAKTDTPEELDDLMEKYNIASDFSLKDTLELVNEVFTKSINDTALIDYNDMLYLTYINKFPVERFDRVLIDEGQDFSNVQTEIALSAVEDDGSISIVGDPNQAIYGFAGAGIDSMEKAIERLGAKVMPLSISYRLPTSHVEYARSCMPNSLVEAAPGAITGVIDDVREEELHQLVEGGDMILCRINRPLVATAFRLLRCGVKAVIRGREIGAGLVSFVDSMKAGSLDDLEGKLIGHLAKKGDKLLERGEEQQYELLVDKVETVRVFADEANSMEELKWRISTLFSDTVQGVLLSSVHKAKGLEAERVFILRPELMPFPKAKRDWELKQEQNLRFVAVTRSKREMYFVKTAEDTDL